MVAENNGLKPLDPLGQPFNPELHQAMSLVDAPQAKPNDVVAVMQKGYVLNDRLLRPALVAIAKPPKFLKRVRLGIDLTTPIFTPSAAVAAQ